jgi:MinD superfamily P-loop ATPase
MVDIARPVGTIEIGQTASGISFVHGLLAIGQIASPAVIAAVKGAAGSADVTLLDCPPGTSCPVIEAVKDADLVLLVTESTPFGLHDLNLAVEMTRALDIPFGVILNRQGLGNDDTTDYCRREGIPILLSIPDDRGIAHAYAEGKPIIEVLPAYGKLFADGWQRIISMYSEAAFRKSRPIRMDKARGSDFMKELAIVSGKGGTGKTSITAAFAALADKKVLVDCDVDAADLHLVLQPELIREEAFSGGNKARIREADCTACGLCVENCHFSAIAYPSSQGAAMTAKPGINPVFCEGCRVCERICPVGAVTLEPAQSGRWFVSRTPYGPMVHAQLGIAQGNSGKLVTLVRQAARVIAEQQGLDLIIIDGPPGVGCPVIASVTGVDMVLVVTEPTLSGRHDLQRVVELTAHFRIPVMLCINKWDIHPGLTEQIEAEATSHGVIAAGRIRYDRLVTEAQIRKTSVTAMEESAVGDDIRHVWRQVHNVLNGKIIRRYHKMSSCSKSELAEKSHLAVKVPSG